MHKRFDNKIKELINRIKVFVVDHSYHTTAVIDPLSDPLMVFLRNTKFIRLNLNYVTGDSTKPIGIIVPRYARKGLVIGRSVMNTNGIIEVSSGIKFNTTVVETFRRNDTSLLLNVAEMSRQTFRLMLRKRELQSYYAVMIFVGFMYRDYFFRNMEEFKIASLINNRKNEALLKEDIDAFIRRSFLQYTLQHVTHKRRYKYLDLCIAHVLHYNIIDEWRD